MNRGTATLLSVNLVILLALLAIEMDSSTLNTKKSITEATNIGFMDYLADDVFGDLAGLTDFAMLQEKNSDGSINITIIKNFTYGNFTSNLNQYKNYLEQNFSSINNAAITLDIENITDGSVETYLFESYLYDDRTNEILFSNFAEGENDYDITIDVISQQPRDTLDMFTWNPGGDTAVELSYTDANGTIEESGNIVSNLTYQFFVVYESGDNMTLTLGKIDDVDGAINIKDSAGNTITIKKTIPAKYINNRPITYNATLEYRNINMKKRDAVWGTR